MMQDPQQIDVMVNMCNKKVRAGVYFPMYRTEKQFWYGVLYTYDPVWYLEMEKEMKGKTCPSTGDGRMPDDVSSRSSEMLFLIEKSPSPLTHGCDGEDTDIVVDATDVLGLWEQKTLWNLTIQSVLETPNSMHLQHTLGIYNQPPWMWKVLRKMCVVSRFCIDAKLGSLECTRNFNNTIRHSFPQLFNASQLWFVNWKLGCLWMSSLHCFCVPHFLNLLEATGSFEDSMDQIRELLSKLIQRGHGWLDSWNGLHRKKMRPVLGCLSTYEGLRLTFFRTQPKKKTHGYV